MHDPLASQSNASSSFDEREIVHFFAIFSSSKAQFGGSLRTPSYISLRQFIFFQLILLLLYYITWDVVVFYGVRSLQGILKVIQIQFSTNLLRH